MTLAWPFRPQASVVESLEWLTNIIDCKQSEYRRSMRPFPRVAYAYSYQLDPTDYGVACELARTVGGSDLWIPDWPNATQIPGISAGTVSLPVNASFAPAYKAGRSALIWDNNASYEIVAITSVNIGTISISATANAYANPMVVPMRIGTIDEAFSGNRGAHLYIEASISFLCVDTEDLYALGSGMGYPTYLDAPVVTDYVELINGVMDRHVRECEVIDSQTGLLYKYPIYSTAVQSSVLGWTALNASELWNLRTWLHSCRGRQKQFWIPSWNKDVVVTKNLSPGDGSIQIAAIGFASKYTLPVDVTVISTVGDFLCVRITSVSAGPAGNELLNFEGALSGHTWTVDSIAKTCKLTLSRFDSDKIEIQHLSGRQATIAVATKEVRI